ncbi:hypothetical protein SAMN02745121_08771 [Nannocystis exedens]|uniref:Tetratricopeptide repeat-containing protein n=1 Tax=Nannocystis exedens TaxID=54 RepID=A0A1I2IJ80_9BACT|nr:hypothetical protein [Nannocystis exedens]PCC69300.1 hypothetical protein NAEX_02322 [Nannocystis exedens]SFF42355.1 hypothetical protein SAMN02745121_08771 [Nannocystis exedens]
MLMRLTLALTMLAPPSQQAADAAFNAGDFRKALDLFRELAADPSVHRPDALHGAHASLIALHGATGEGEHLCHALELTRELLASGPFADAEERAAWTEIEARDVDRVKRAGVTCAAATSDTTPAGTPVATTDSSASGSPAGSLAAASQPPWPQAGEPNVDALLPVKGRPPSARSTALGRGRELLIAGGVTLGVGVGLATAAGVLGGRMLDIWREADALYEANGPVGPDTVADQSAALARDYHRLQAPMLATAVIGGSALVVGAVLTGVGAKRLSRATSRAALLPAPGGLVLRARF